MHLLAISFLANVTLQFRFARYGQNVNCKRWLGLLFMPDRICIQKISDHFLIRGMMPVRFMFEKIETGSAERDRDFYLLFFERQFVRRGEKIPDYAQFAH